MQGALWEDKWEQAGVMTDWAENCINPGNLQLKQTPRRVSLTYKHW